MPIRYQHKYFGAIIFMFSCQHFFMIYFHSKDDKARFALGTEGGNTLVVFGVNPSTAVPDDPDKTIQSVMRHAEAKEFDSWIMLNLYPQIATDFSEVHQECDQSLHQKNLEEIRKILGSLKKYTLCCAWGGLITQRRFLFTCLQEITRITGVENWHSIGDLINGGHPHHPLFLSAAFSLKRFDMDSYIKQDTKTHTSF